MQIELRRLAELKAYPGNPRVNDSAVEAVAASLKEFGFRQPLVVDAEDVLVCGHTRFKAAVKLGLESVPVHVARDLSPEQIRAYRIADNRTAENAEWDYNLLPIELLGLQEADYDLGLLGFDPDELARLLGTGGAGEGDPDEVPELPLDPVTRLGDLWVLGEHRLLCGDSTEADDVARLLVGDDVDLLLADPPYGVSYTGATAEALTIANDDLDEAAYGRFLADALGAAVPALRPGAPFYLWHADTAGYAVRGACRLAGLRVRQCLVWVKSTLVLGRQDYHWKHEPCLYGWKDGAAHTWLGDRRQTTVLAFDKPARNGVHPTMKPVALFAELMPNSCLRGGVVLDPFGGSGTTLIAAEETGRKARLLELDPRYCDVIVERYEAVTGKKASLATEGVGSPTLAGVGAGGGVERPGADEKRPRMGASWAFCGGVAQSRNISLTPLGPTVPSGIAAASDFLAFVALAAGGAFGVLVAFRTSPPAAAKCPLVARRKRPVSPFAPISRRMAE